MSFVPTPACLTMGAMNTHPAPESEQLAFEFYLATLREAFKEGGMVQVMQEAQAVADRARQHAQKLQRDNPALTMQEALVAVHRFMPQSVLSGAVSEDES